MAGKLIIISGPSGAGKSTIVKHLKENTGFELEFSVSATSRPKRENETEGKEYYFLTIDVFKSQIEEKQFLEWEEVYPKQYYGTLKSEINRLSQSGKNIIFDVDAVGGTNIKRQYKDAAISFFIKPPSVEILEERLRNRATESEESLQKRLKKVRLEMTYARRYDHEIINDNLELTLNEVTKLVSDFLKS
ncbi:MAG: guanylate kinase [Bacteroidales bacterium]|nr:guanylate kinase [Bacteroidales bacterium]MBN2819622.1 guanylate kinase [Bacteroidales bacterium]